jgi:DNA polymerase elongation subunit (family B)
MQVRVTMASNVLIQDYIKSKRKINTSEVYKKDIDFQIIEWWAQDEEDDADEQSEDEDQQNSYFNKDTYTIRCFGVTDQGLSITCKIKGFCPFYYIKVDSSFNKVKLNHFLNFMSSSYALKKYPNALVKENGRHKSCLVEKKDIFGFRNGKYYKYIKLVFSNYRALMNSRYIFKKPVNIPNVTTKPTKFKLYESNFEGFMRYCHIKDILMAGWIRVPKGKYTVTQSSATTDLEVEIDRTAVVSLKDKQEMAPFLQASWDIEVYSHDYTFPDPNKKIRTADGSYVKPNEIFQIATTFKRYGDKDMLFKHLLTLKKCAKIDDPKVIVEECKNEKELIKRWVDLISTMDPDIFYTYNGDSFDCMYLIQRSIIHGLVSEDKKSGYVLNKLSRMGTPCEVKREYFSSSAYGDSEYTRLYIPGRLNYDLLIHYKRGMKKYPSYKLDYIANEILKEGKHDVGVKEIFKYYEDGTPEKIRSIGEYCIQDTELLQKLVDKQLILTNIIQLANVTFVPIGFLTTRGQTIKVYSQLLRKARQMDFLVPHTNFNEDSYPICIKMKDEDVFDESSIGEYIEVSVELESKRSTITARISEIVDSTNIIALADTEITREYFNKRITHKRRDYLATRVWSNEDAINDSFTGATVLEPMPGKYEDNIAVLDFASLYPTIMISRNLCYSTFVNDSRYLDIPNVKYETIKWDDKVEFKMKQTCEGVGKSGKSKGQVCGKQAYFEVDNQYFCRIHDPLKKQRLPDEKCQKQDVSYSYTIVQPHMDESNCKVNQGVLPALLEELYSERKKVKKQMAKAQQEGNKLLAEILDSTQLAIKVSLNSTYGFLGRCQGNLILKELGSIVTSVGRMLIEQSKEYAEGEFLQHIKDNTLLTHTVKSKQVELSKREKEIVLKRFRVI